jgi:hypothetical protein
VAYRPEALQAAEYVWRGVVEAGTVLGGGEAGNGVPRPGRPDLGRGCFLLSFTDGHLPSFSWLSAPPVRHRPLSPLSRLATLNHGILPAATAMFEAGLGRPPSCSFIPKNPAPLSLSLNPHLASSTISISLSSRRGRAGDGDGGISHRQRPRVCDPNGLTTMPALP